MTNKKRGLSPIILAALSMILVGCATAGEYYTTAHWKESVTLHDGRELIVERTIKKDPHGIREPFHGDPIARVVTTFILPGTNKSIEWVSDFTHYPEENDLTLLAVDIINGVPYIATAVRRCQGMNIWGRPNPPQVLFKYNGTDWQRIPVADFPEEIAAPNVMVRTSNFKTIAYLFTKGKLVEKEIVRKRNNELEDQHYQRILRDPISTGYVNPSICPETFYDGRGGWEMLRGYKNSKSLQDCFIRCKIHRLESSYCPCNKLFSREK